jgi:ADP-ribosylglycohydrolase
MAFSMPGRHDGQNAMSTPDHRSRFLGAAVGSALGDAIGELAGARGGLEAIPERWRLYAVAALWSFTSLWASRRARKMP